LWTARDDVNPIGELSHQHGDLTTLLIAVRDALARMRNEGGAAAGHELRDGVDALREDLLLHFAREEEALLPFVVERFPSLGARAEKLHDDHQIVCRRTEALLAAANRVLDGGSLDECATALEELEEVYTRHMQTELVLLRELDESLDPSARAELRVLLATT
jgi:hemerythrin HHE cation binding domain-containing protein